MDDENHFERFWELADRIRKQVNKAGGLSAKEIGRLYADVFTHAPAIAVIDAQLLMDEIEASSQRVKIGGALQVCKDPDDDMFLETAVTGGADFLVTKITNTFRANRTARRAS